MFWSKYKIMKKIHIADNVGIGVKAVIAHNIFEPNTV